MSLQDDVKARTLALISQQMAEWVVEIQRSIQNHQGSLMKALDSLGEEVARYDEKIDEARIDAAVAEVLAGATAGGEAGGGAAMGGLDRVKASVFQIEKGANLSEVLTHLVNEVSGYVDRCAMFIVKGPSAIGWYAKGFESSDAAKTVSVPLTADTLFSQVNNSRAPLSIAASASASTVQAMAKLGSAPHGMLGVPLILRDKLAAILYCDSTQGALAPGTADGIELLVVTAGKCIDLLSLGAKPPVRAAAPAAAPAAAAPAPAPARPAAPAPPPAPAPAPAADEGSSTVMFNPSQMAAMRQAVGGAAAPAAAPALSAEDQKAHEDAKRFARLVVSEIKLYNEAKVNEGRARRDLYERLKEDIERGRQMYSERVAANVRDNSNYFYDELVRILAGGDPAVLGAM